MKKIITLSAVAFLSTAVYAEVDLKKLDFKVNYLQKKVSEINKNTSNDNIKFDVDFRTAVDMLNYETAKGEEYSNDALLSNRLWLNMGYAPANDMVFKGQLAYHKAYGAAPITGGYPQRGMGFDTFDWVSSQTLNDDKVRVREAYWLWMPKVGDLSFTASLGRRPSTNGYLSNLREDDKKAKSPLGHVINMEFDGASAGVTANNILPGFMFKLCLGRGLTNAKAWSNSADTVMATDAMGPTSQNYIEDDSAMDTIDMAGFIFVPYDDGQYAVKTTWYRGKNVPGLIAGSVNAYYNGLTGAQMGMAPTSDWAMKTTGDMDGMAISFKVDGIGDGINDFLDETTFFASYATSKSHPDKANTRTVTMIDVTGTNPTSTVKDSTPSMMGSTESETGSSIWLGVNMPNMTGGRFGLEYNKGDEYWRPFTYGEDTMIGSKLAARGSAIEAYWSQPLINDAFSMQVRYTQIDYDYTGSNGFFGDGGTSMSIDDAVANGMDPVETAQDLRVYFRYRY